MSFIGKLGCFINQQAAEWRMLHEAEKQYPNKLATFAKACGTGIAHWGLSSLAAICFAVEGLYQDRWTEQVANDDLFSVTCWLMAGFLVLHFALDFFNKRFTKNRCLGYLVGALLGVIVFAWSLGEIFQFTTTSTIQYLSYILAGRLWCEGAAFMLGPMTNTQKSKK